MSILIRVLTKQNEKEIKTTFHRQYINKVHIAFKDSIFDVWNEIRTLNQRLDKR